MLEYDRIDVSEGIDINKTNASKETKIFHYWYFNDIGFKYEPYLCNGCHGLMQKAVSFNHVTIVKGSAYRIYFWYMSKKLIDLTYYQRNRDMIINRAKNYYENDKTRLREQARGKYINLSEEDKNKKREYGRNRYHNMSEEKKQKLKEYQKNYRETKKLK